MICGSCRLLLSERLFGIIRNTRQSRMPFGILGNYKERYLKSFLQRYSSLETKAPDLLISETMAKEEPSPVSFEEFDKFLPSVIDIAPSRAPIHSDSFADYVNFSETLRSLIMLGVQLFKIEKNHPSALKYLIALDLVRDVKPRLEYLIRLGVRHSEIGHMITRNPKILDPEKDFGEIKEVIDYLTEMKFGDEEILSVIVRLPTVLTIPVAALDGILGFYQCLATNRSERKINFSSKELRTIIVRCPSLITSNLRAVFEKIQILEISCEFTLGQIRKLIIGFPGILIKEEKQLEFLYKFYFREMGLTNEEITDFPCAFTTRIRIVLERHSYLKLFNKAVYKRDEPGYLSPWDIYTGTDEEFCRRLGLDASHFNRFIKSL